MAQQPGAFLNPFTLLEAHQVYSGSIARNVSDAAFRSECQCGLVWDLQTGPDAHLAEILTEAGFMARRIIDYADELQRVLPEEVRSALEGLAAESAAVTSVTGAVHMGPIDPPCTTAHKKVSL